MLTLHTSNRLERLVDALAVLVGQPLSSPLAREHIVVQSKGMERWVAMRLAERLGVWANCVFPFPEAMVREVFAASGAELPDTSVFRREIMTLSLMDLIPARLDQPPFTQLARYLDDDATGLKLWQLASRVAAVFDQYIIFRPEMVAAWEAGQESHWQAELWRALVARHGATHRAAVRDLFLTRLRAGDGRPHLPERLTVFGISSLPPFYLDILAALAQFIDVHIFVMNPCQEYWGDILSVRESSRQARHLAENYLETGNTLLASMGRLGRDFIDMLQGYECDQEELFEEPGGANLLAAVQSDILHLREAGADASANTVFADDLSVQFHSCHSPMREVEVLHDRLLDLLARHADLEPQDVVVMAPDIETYTPFIQAVFAGQAAQERQIPFSIADRTARNSNAVVTAFFAMLDLVGGRFGAAEVFRVLECDCVRQRFRISTGDLEIIHRWLARTRIAWGIDGSHRAGLGFPDFAENSWAAGLDRMMLGYAMPGREGRTFAGILPFDDVEGSLARLLGELYEFMAELAPAVRDLARPRPLAEWRDLLRGLLTRFVALDVDNQIDLLMLTGIIDELASEAIEAAFVAPITLAVVRADLEQRLARETGHLFQKGVTFCTLKPMRAIPFPVVCLLGMNDGVFPASHRPPAFDLLAAAPRRGDRSRRLDDRYLFLEALLSARRYFMISYVGQSIQDNTVLPPSVLVSELLDYLTQGYVWPAGTLIDHVLIRHPLQPFSPRYFTENGAAPGALFSFSREYCVASCALVREKQAVPPLFSGLLPEPPAAFRSLSVDRLAEFFGNPVRFLLRERLGIHCDDQGVILNEQEPFVLDWLDRYQLQELLLASHLEGRESASVHAGCRARGILPYGRAGELLLQDQDRQMAALADDLREFHKSAPLPDLEINLTLAGFHLHGVLPGLRQDYLLRVRPSSIKGKDYIRAWIYHLVLNLAGPAGHPCQTLLVGRKEKSRSSTTWTTAARRFEPVSAAGALLEELLCTYWQGLRTPLPLFAESSLAFASRVRAGEGDDVAIQAGMEQAFRAWRDSYNKEGERGKDHYYRFVFPEGEPLPEDFQKQALAFFGPLLDHLRDEGGS